MTPPPLSTNANKSKKGKPFGITSMIIAGIGALPLLIYFITCIGHFDSAYRTGGNPLLIVGMGFIGFLVHGIGLACGIIGLSLGNKQLGLIGGIANAVILGLVLILGFIAIAGG